MSSEAQLAFLSWTRQVTAAGTTTPDPLAGPLPGVGTVRLGFRVNARAERSLNVRRYGPGDVTALDIRQVIRTDPRPGDDTFPPNLFPLVELDRPDLPWLLTPAGPADRDRLRPWLVLVVVEQDQAELVPGGALPALRCPLGQLPDLAESHLWAHAQVALDGALDDARLDRLLAEAPERTLSRLVCPRRLLARTAYLACVVPAFAAGVKAGLGQDVTDADLATLQPAWTPGAGEAPLLPVYYHWQFATGAAGSFEALVDRLQGRPLPRRVGVRDLDVSRPGGGLPSLPAGHPGAIVELEGALRSPQTFAAPWDAAARAGFEAALRPRLEPGGPGGSDVIPPVYGLQHARRRGFAGDADLVTWLRQLNLDPRFRAIAALGTRAVQDNQEDLIAAAWEQAAAVAEVNQALRQGQLGRTADQAIYDRRIDRNRPGAALPDEQLLQISFPAHQAAGTAAALAPSRSVSATATPAFRKLTRPGRTLARNAGPAVARPLRRLAAGDVTVLPPLATPPGLASPEALSQRGESMRRLTGDRVKLPGWAGDPTGPTEVPVPADPRVSLLGAVMPNRVFATTTDGRVMSRVSDGGRGAWQDHGTPPGTTAVSAPVAIRDLYAYVAGADRHVYSLAWDGDAWAWRAHPLPGGRLLVPGGAPWGTWSNHDPASGDIGQIPPPVHNMVWAVADDGTLRELRGSSWVSHGSPGTALTGQPGSVHPWCVLVRAADGRLFQRDKSSGAWVWQDLGGTSATGQPLGWDGLRVTLRTGGKLSLRLVVLPMWVEVHNGVATLLGVHGDGVVVSTHYGMVLWGHFGGNGWAWDFWLPAPPGFTGRSGLQGVVRSDGTVVTSVAGRHLEGRPGGSWTDFGHPLPAGAGAPGAPPPRNRRWRVPLGFMSNLLVAHVDAGAGGDRVHPRVGADVGFDAEARGGWALRDPMPDPPLGTDTQGLGIALADVRGRRGDAPRRDLVALWVQTAANGGNYPRYRIGWDVDGTGKPTSWSDEKQSPTPVATTTTSSGALTMRAYLRDTDVDVADLDADGRPELIMAYVTGDDPPRTYYRIGWGLDAAGELTQGWSESRLLPAPDGPVVGIGVAVVDTTAQLRPDLVVLYVTKVGSGLRATYRIGYGLNARGLVTGGWGPAIAVGGGPVPAAIQGASLTAADFSGSERADLVVLLVENGATDNYGRYRVGWDLSPTTGQARSWTPEQQIPGWWGWENRGAGVAVGDFDAALLGRKKAFAEAFTVASASHQDVLARAQQLAAADDARLPLPAVAAAARQVLQPAQRVERRVAARVQGLDLTRVGATDPLNPLLAAPSFDMAAYELARDVDAGLLLPGIDHVPPETVSLLRATPAFIEAFLVGLNHELGRELLWRELPADRTATFFQHFWDRAGARAAVDIPPIAGWRPAAALGDHASGVGGPDMAVLVVRGELLRRYPNTMVYGIKAGTAAGGQRVLTATTMQPDFRGTIPPDLTFFGFPFTVAEARGMGGDAGWFFAFAEHPTEPRFGLDEPGEHPAYGAAPVSWNHLDWAGVVPSEAALQALTHVPEQVPFPRPTDVPLRDDRPSTETFRWAESSAHMAHITLQRPVLLAIHASDLLSHTAGDWRITHVDRHGRRIVAVGGTRPDGKWWRLGLSEAIAAIRQQERLYVQPPGQPRAEVAVVRARSGLAYLRTRAGGGGANNLLSLPELPEHVDA